MPAILAFLLGPVVFCYLFRQFMGFFITDAVRERGDASYEYSPFGEVITSSGTLASDNPFRFSTKYFDPETGLGYWGYRWYDAGKGRWLGRDRIEEAGGVNLYGYCGNDGVGTVDLLGMADAVLPPTRVPHVLKDYSDVLKHFGVKIEPTIYGVTLVSPAYSDPRGGRIFIHSQVSKKGTGWYQRQSDDALFGKAMIGPITKSMIGTTRMDDGRDVIEILSSNPETERSPLAYNDNAMYNSVAVHEMIGFITQRFSGYGENVLGVGYKTLSGYHYLALMAEWGQWAQERPLYACTMRLRLEDAEMSHVQTKGAWDADLRKVTQVYRKDAQDALKFAEDCEAGKKEGQTFMSKKYAPPANGRQSVTCQTTLKCQNKLVSSGAFSINYTIME